MRTSRSVPARLFALLAFVPAPALAANLNINGALKMDDYSYSDLNLNSASPNNRDFLETNAQLGVAIDGVSLKQLGEPKLDNTTMDAVLKLHAIGVTNSGLETGSTASGVLGSQPFKQISQNYPAVDYSPFVENAYVDIKDPYGVPLKMAIGRQSFKLGSGMLLDDDGAGFDGARVQATLPWWEIKTQAFAFVTHDAHYAVPDNLGLYGFGADLPVQKKKGNLQINELVEKDNPTAPVPVEGCIDPGPSCLTTKSFKSFSDLEYNIDWGHLSFNGEAALERGEGSGVAPTPAHITYQGDAEVLNFKWTQPLYHLKKPGIARIIIARGSGDRGGSSGIDGAFFPSHGHQFDGMARDGYGNFFGATPYSAFGGNYATTGSSANASGLAPGASGIDTVGVGITPPAWHGIVLDAGYYLFQADRVLSGSKTLGTEWDADLHYDIRQHLTLEASMGLFKAGTASQTTGSGSANVYSFLAVGRF